MSWILELWPLYILTYDPKPEGSLKDYQTKQQQTQCKVKTAKQESSNQEDETKKDLNLIIIEIDHINSGQLAPNNLNGAQIRKASPGSQEWAY